MAKLEEDVYPRFVSALVKVPKDKYTNDEFNLTTDVEELDELKIRFESYEGEYTNVECLEGIIHITNEYLNLITDGTVKTCITPDVLKIAQEADAAIRKELIRLATLINAHPPRPNAQQRVWRVKYTQEHNPKEMERLERKRKQTELLRDHGLEDTDSEDYEDCDEEEGDDEDDENESD